jgi:hypothetical protein
MGFYDAGNSDAHPPKVADLLPALVVLLRPNRNLATKHGAERNHCRAQTANTVARRKYDEDLRVYKLRLKVRDKADEEALKKGKEIRLQRNQPSIAFSLLRPDKGSNRVRQE